MSTTFSVLDIQRLQTCDHALQDILIEAREIVPFMVLEGHRGQAAQEAAFAAGKSQLHWPHGKHNGVPSQAVDVAPIYFSGDVRQIDWGDLVAFGRIMGVVQAVAHKRGVKLRFGLDWDGDFRSVGRDPDEHFMDAPHIELVR